MEIVVNEPVTVTHSLTLFGLQISNNNHYFQRKVFFFLKFLVPKRIIIRKYLLFLTRYYRNLQNPNRINANFNFRPFVFIFYRQMAAPVIIMKELL